MRSAGITLFWKIRLSTYPVILEELQKKKTKTYDYNNSSGEQVCSRVLTERVNVCLTRDGRRVITPRARFIRMAFRSLLTRNNTGDTLITYVYIPPTRPSREWVFECHYCT